LSNQQKTRNCVSAPNLCLSRIYSYNAGIFTLASISFICGIDINSVKLWYNGDFVEAEWGIATKRFLLVGFSRNKVVEMLDGEKGLVELTVTGLVNSIEFYGTDTITVIKPRR